MPDEISEIFNVYIDNMKSIRKSIFKNIIALYLRKRKKILENFTLELINRYLFHVSYPFSHQ